MGTGKSSSPATRLPNELEKTTRIENFPFSRLSCTMYPDGIRLVFLSISSAM